MGRAFEYRRAAKEKRWDKMSKVFPKLARAITLAAREGGTDPDMNATLRMAIQNAKAENMPKDNIEAAIKRAEGKDVDAIAEMTYEGKGPHGTLFFVECATDNPKRTIANVRSYFNKHGGGIVPSGSLEFMFERKAVFQFPVRDDLDLEALELDCIDAGLESIESDQGVVTAMANYTDYGSLGQALEDRGINITKSSLQRLPITGISLTDQQLDEVEPLIDKLEDDEDVQVIFSNIA